MESKFVSNHRVELLIPRPNKVYHDRTGYFCTYGIWKLIDDAFFEAQTKGFLRIDFNDSGYRIYSIRDRATYSPRIHRQICSTNSDLLYRVAVLSVGTTTYTIIEQLIDACTNEVLVSAENKTVAVDQSSRRPRKLLQWLIEEWSTFINVESKLGKQEDFIPPHDAFRSIVLTRYSDTDKNSHVSHAEYYRFCEDCASEASLSSYYNHYNEDLSWFPVLETDVTFHGESPPCVELEIFTWQNPNNVQRIYFAIYKTEEKIFQASYLYSPEKSLDSKL